jgi:hypothetical protein
LDLYRSSQTGPIRHVTMLKRTENVCLMD